MEYAYSEQGEGVGCGSPPVTILVGTPLQALVDRSTPGPLSAYKGLQVHEIEAVFKIGTYPFHVWRGLRRLCPLLLHPHPGRQAGALCLSDAMDPARSIWAASRICRVSPRLA